MRLSSQVSDGWFQAGLAGSILFNPDQQHSPVAIVTGFAILLLPYSIVGPYVGVLLDRWDRRASLSVANLVRAFMVLPAAAMLWTGSQNVIFILSALIVIAINRFFLAGLSASLPRVVDEEKLVPANALATTLGTISYSLGLFSAAVLIAINVLDVNGHGYATVAIIGSVGYLASGLLCRWLFRHGSLGPLAHEKRSGQLFQALYEVAKGLAAGMRHLAQRRVAARVIALQTAYRTLFGMLTLALLLLYSRYFGEGQAYAEQSLQDLGLVVIVGAAGAGLAAVVTPFGVRHLGTARWLTSLVLGVAVVLVVFGLPFDKYMLLVAAFLINVTAQSMRITVDATIQRECDDSYRGRIFSLNDTGFNLSFVAGMFIAATTFPANGKSATGLLIAAAAFVVLATWYGIAGSPRRLDRREDGALKAIRPARRFARAKN